MSKQFRCLFTFVALSLLSVPALAQDFYWKVASARSLAMGGTYVPSSTGVIDALSANPAGLAALGPATLDLNVTGLFARGSFTNSVNRNAPLNTSPGVLPYGAFGAPIGRTSWRFGVGVVPELMSVADWRYVDAPGVAGASYGLQKQKSAILAARATGGVGFAVGKSLLIGATVGVVYNSNTLEAPYIFQSHPALKGLKTLLDLHTSGTGWNTSVGILARTGSKVRLGLAWKSRTVIESTGDASGNAGAQFAALGLPFQPDFQYAAKVRNVLPQSVMGSVLWQVDPRWLVAFQTNWVNWKDAFVVLPVTLTGGANADINGLLGSNSISDGVPLYWKDQVMLHVGVERLLTERTSLRGGYAYGNNPVPGTTLSPLTAAIMSNHLSTGVGHQFGRCRVELAYSLALAGHAQVGQSGLLSGEYNNSQIRVGTQSISLNTSIQF